jgi:endonuclease/exonuclease/phosphatase family metal-dependent hydrolase
LSTAVALVVGVFLASCSGSDGSGSADGGTAGSPGSDQSTGSASDSLDPLDLSLLVFNVEYGGTKHTDAVMADVDADVVGVLESYNRLPEIAKAAGYPYYDLGLQILSKYPILEPSAAHGLYAYIEVRPGQVVAMINTHLDYVHDGPNRLNRGVPVSKVLASERRDRLSSIEKLLPSATQLLGQGWPVFLTGDLNEPSNLDWTAATASQHGGVGPVDWPVSKAILATGMHDSFRVANPDPVTVPGNTWGHVAGRKDSTPRRIDYAYVGGPVTVQSSQVVGEVGGPGVDLGYPNWTSDHRAVLSRLTVTPVPMPTTLALSSRMLTVGDTVTATYRLPEGSTGGVVNVSGADSDATHAASYEATGRDGTLSIPTAALAPGEHHVELVTTGGVVAASNEFYVRPEDAHVKLTTDAASYAVGQPITVRWTDGPANRWDWIGFYRAGAANPNKDDYLIWGYTGGHDAGALPPSTTGEMVFGPDHQGTPWPLPPGRYVVHYLLTDQYHSVGHTSFVVR